MAAPANGLDLCQWRTALTRLRRDISPGDGRDRARELVGRPVIRRQRPWKLGDHPANLRPDGRLWRSDQECTEGGFDIPSVDMAIGRLLRRSA